MTVFIEDDEVEKGYAQALKGINANVVTGPVGLSGIVVDCGNRAGMGIRHRCGMQSRGGRPRRAEEKGGPSLKRQWCGLPVH